MMRLRVTAQAAEAARFPDRRRSGRSPARPRWSRRACLPGFTDRADGFLRVHSIRRHGGTSALDVLVEPSGIAAAEFLGCQDPEAVLAGHPAVPLAELGEPEPAGPVGGFPRPGHLRHLQVPPSGDGAVYLPPDGPEPEPERRGHTDH